MPAKPSLPTRPANIDSLPRTTTGAWHGCPQETTRLGSSSKSNAKTSLSGDILCLGEPDNFAARALFGGSAKEGVRATTELNERSVRWGWGSSAWQAITAPGAAATARPAITAARGAWRGGAIFMLFLWYMGRPRAITAGVSGRERGAVSLGGLRAITADAHENRWVDMSNVVPHLFPLVRTGETLGEYVGAHVL